jgi:hypothetical protein
MAFFDLNRKIQVILIASGLAISPAGCKPPGEKPPEDPKDKKTGKGACKSLDIVGVEVMVTRSTSTRSTLQLTLKGTIPEGTELEEATAGKGIEVVRSSVSSDGVLTVEIKHAGLQPGDVGTLLVDVKSECGSVKATLRDRIGICKQAGGLKILETADATCPGVPAQPDAGPVIVDPVPYPVDPPPPPPDPVPYPADPVPYPGDPPPPPPDPVPPPHHPGKDPVPMPIDAMVYDCVPDAMGPAASASTDIHAGHASDKIQPRIVPEREGDASWRLHVVERLGSDVGKLNITWSSSAGTLEPRTGPETTWTPPDDGRVHAVMAVIEKNGLVLVETWKMVPGKGGE